MRAYLGVSKDGRILFGMAESFEDFLMMARLSNIEEIRSIDVTDVILNQNTNVIEVNPRTMWEKEGRS